MPNLIERSSRLALDLLFPPRCALCGQGGTLLCAACIDALPPADGRRCPVCWMPTSHAGTCPHCTERRPDFASVRAAFVMDGGARRLAHELKYEGLTSLAEPMAQLMAPLATSSDVVIPVPLHRSRLQARGYNQAAALAKHLARGAGMPADTAAMRRVRNTAPLAKTMHREERRAIVAGAFVAQAEAAEGRRVLLVDDVVTTGATLDAASEALLSAGATEVRCVVWARAD